MCDLQNAPVWPLAFAWEVIELWLLEDPERSVWFDEVWCAATCDVPEQSFTAPTIHELAGKLRGEIS